MTVFILFQCYSKGECNTTTGSARCAYLCGSCCNLLLRVKHRKAGCAHAGFPPSWDSNSVERGAH